MLSPRAEAQTARWRKWMAAVASPAMQERPVRLRRRRFRSKLQRAPKIIGPDAAATPPPSDCETSRRTIFREDSPLPGRTRLSLLRHCRHAIAHLDELDQVGSGLERNPAGVPL